jgi:hypothetical protein
MGSIIDYLKLAYFKSDSAPKLFLNFYMTKTHSHGIVRPAPAPMLNVAACCEI